MKNNIMVIIDVKCEMAAGQTIPCRPVGHENSYEW